ncbi:MAG: hypothetical protein JO119_15450 [Acidobacteria bacterium]|nr:hypothetical protein [Acidobacteriota bacterium]
MDPLIAFLVALVFGGYLLPIPSFGMATYRYFRPGAIVPGVMWRRTLTGVVLLACAAALVFWSYAVFRQAHNDYSYVLPSARFGRWLSVVLAALSLPAEGKVRTYLLLFAIGLFLFFGCSIGELP